MVAANAAAVERAQALLKAVEYRPDIPLLFTPVTLVPGSRPATPEPPAGEEMKETTEQEEK